MALALFPSASTPEIADLGAVFFFDSHLHHFVPTRQWIERPLPAIGSRPRYVLLTSYTPCIFPRLNSGTRPLTVVNQAAVTHLHHLPRTHTRTHSERFFVAGPDK